jgi:uncharacterized membrane protein
MMPRRHARNDSNPTYALDIIVVVVVDIIVLMAIMAFLVFYLVLFFAF